MFKMLATKYRRIRGLVWFDQVDRGIDWPLETAPGGDECLRPRRPPLVLQGQWLRGRPASPVPPPR